MAKSSWAKRVLAKARRDNVAPQKDADKALAHLTKRLRGPKKPMSDGERYDLMLARGHANRQYHPIRHAEAAKSIPHGSWNAKKKTSIKEWTEGRQKRHHIISKRIAINRGDAIKKAWATRKRLYGPSGTGKKGNKSKRTHV